jgi:hypothetical protein
MPWLGDVNADVGPFALHMRSCGRQGRAPKPVPCSDCGAELHPIIVARGGTLHWLCGGVPKPRELFLPAAGAPSLPKQLDLTDAADSAAPALKEAAP